MSKSEDIIELTGVVTEILPGAKFKVKATETNHEVLCTLSGKLRLNKIQIIVGDSITFEVSPYDLKRGRITWRNK